MEEEQPNSDTPSPGSSVNRQVTSTQAETSPSSSASENISVASSEVAESSPGPSVPRLVTKTKGVGNNECLEHLTKLRQGMYSLMKTAASGAPQSACVAEGNALMTVLKQFSDSRKQLKTEPMTLREQDERIAELKKKIKMQTELHKKLVGNTTVPTPETKSPPKSAEEHWAYKAAVRAAEARKAQLAGRDYDDDGEVNELVDRMYVQPSDVHFLDESADGASYSRLSDGPGFESLSSGAISCDIDDNAAAKKSAAQKKKEKSRKSKAAKKSNLAAGAAVLEDAFPPEKEAVVKFVNFPLDGNVGLFKKPRIEEPVPKPTSAPESGKNAKKYKYYRPPRGSTSKPAVDVQPETEVPLPGPAKLTAEQIDALRGIAEEQSDKPEEQLPGVFIDEKEERIQRFKLDPNNVDPELALVLKDMDLM